MSQEIIKKSINQLVRLAQAKSIRKVNLKLAGGEPLLAINSVKFITDYIKKFENRVDIKIFIITNGSLITPKIVNFLKQHNITIVISLDGLEKYHDKQRVFANGSGTFKSVLKGINTLIDLKYPKKLIGISIVVSKYNIDGLYELTKFLLQHRFEWRYSLVREDKKNKSIKPPIKKIISVFSKCFNLIEKEMYQDLIIDTMFDRINLANIPYTKCCSAGECYVAISSDGRISTCPMGISTDYFIQKKELTKFLKEEPTGISKFDIDNIEECKDCHWRYICAGGCPLINLNKKSIYCEAYKAIIPHLIHLKLAYDSKFGKKNIDR